MKAIMACDTDGGIGYKGKLPWSSLESDLSRFKELTLKKSVLMGRLTWASLPKKPLPYRQNIVYSRLNLNFSDNVIQISDLAQLPDHKDVWFIGGAQLLELVYPIISEFHLTRAKQKYVCDTFIDLLYLENNFEKISTVEYSDNNYEHWIRR